MPNTTNDWAHAWLRIREFSRIYSLMRQFGSSQASVGFWGFQENVMTYDKAIFDADVEQGESIGLLQQRAFVAGILGSPRSILDPLLLQLSRAMGYPQTDPTAVFPILYRYMALNQGSFKSAPRVYSRAFSRGSWTAGGSNQGNGTVLRMTVDAYDLPIESDQPDVYKALCVVDANSGANPGQEQFRVTGLPFKDILAMYQTGTYSIGIGNNIPVPNLIGVSADSSRDFLVNPSFSDYSGAGDSATFGLTGWTLAAGAVSTCSIDTSQYYRASNIEGTAPGSLKTTATVSFKQKIPANQFNSALAYMCQAACNFSAGGATGSVRMRLGTEAVYLVDVTVNSGVAGWNTIRPTIDKKLYFQNFAGTGDIYLRFDITVSSGSYILLDDVCLSNFQNIGGKLLWAIGGATNWVVGDSGTITDTATSVGGFFYPTSAHVQQTLAEVYGRSLPASTFSNAPAAPTTGVTGGGTTAKGRYGVVITFYNGTTGAESKASLETNVILDGTTNTRIALTVIPTGPAGTTDRYIYITQPDDWNDPSSASTGFGGKYQSAYYFAAALGDNATTSKTFDPVATIDLTKPLAVLEDVS